MTYSKRVFLVQIWDFLFFHKAFHFDKFEGTDFKYGYNFLNLNPKIIQKRHFWFQVWKFIVLHKILLNDRFENADGIFGIFGLEFENNIVIFEIGTLKFV